MTSLSLPTIPESLPAVFVCQLVDGAGGPPSIILARNEDDTLSIPFIETKRLRAYLQARSHAYFCCRLLGRCVLVIGPEVDGWDGEEEVYTL